MAFRDLILTNLRRKLFALALAILVWMTIHFAESRQRRAPALNTTTNSTAINL
ncbi:MAG TPA: hypothetical protein VK846_01880 [Candidatus Limnocylindria bacterium]|nr:hypothetical protein [Candidatus Limnocylindria bacterium]